LPSNDKGIFTGPLPTNNKGTLPSRCLATIKEIDVHTYTDSNVISLAYSIFPKEESGLKKRIAEDIDFVGPLLHLENVVSF
jgi:hypothetical protein